MNAQELLSYKNWAVAGDVLNSSKYAHKILYRLKDEGYHVVGVNPRISPEDIYDIEVYRSLKEAGAIEVLDLCINPSTGMDIVKEAKELGIKHILIQPGAESQDIIDYCVARDINVIQGCVLVELSNR